MASEMTKQGRTAYIPWPFEETSFDGFAPGN
jgi:hypothetical protein